MASKLTQISQERTAAQLQSMTQESTRWLLKKVAEIRNPSFIARDIKDERDRYVKSLALGKLYCFYYNAKTKEKLDYWDKFPLVLVLEKYSDGFLGLNLHYLPIRYRVAFMDKLMDYAVTKDDDIMKMRVTYDILVASRRLREFKPCLKRYLYGQLNSKILAIQPNEWETAVFLPMQQFKGAKPQQVWQESIETIKE